MQADSRRKRMSLRASPFATAYGSEEGDSKSRGNVTAKAVTHKAPTHLTGELTGI